MIDRDRSNQIWKKLTETIIYFPVIDVLPLLAFTVFIQATNCQVLDLCIKFLVDETISTVSEPPTFVSSVSNTIPYYLVPQLLNYLWQMDSAVLIKSMFANRNQPNR